MRMATLSITVNFYCDNAKAVDACVDLLPSGRSPANGYKLVLVERNVKSPEPLECYTRWNFQSWDGRYDDKDGVDYDQIPCVLSNVLVA